MNGVGRVDFGYDADGLLTSAGSLAITRRSDTGLTSGTTLGVITTTESQNNHGELWKVESKHGGTALYSAIYARDSLGRIVQINEAIQGVATTKVYTYSDTGWLNTVSVDGTITERYAYDQNGNRTRVDAPGDSASALYDDQDRLLRYGQTAFRYRAGGDLDSAITGAAKAAYTYDAMGNLTRVITQAGDTVDYLVDAQNRRVVRRLNGVTTAKWLYEDQLRIAAELNGSNEVVSRFVYGGHANVPEYMLKASHTYRLVLDHLGSVRMVVDSADGSIAQKLDYDSWGRIIVDTNPGFQPFGFAGGLLDGVTGLLRFGARDYDAKIGRWTTRVTCSPEADAA